MNLTSVQVSDFLANNEIWLEIQATVKERIRDYESRLRVITVEELRPLQARLEELEYLVTMGDLMLQEIQEKEGIR